MPERFTIVPTLCCPSDPSTPSESPDGFIGNYLMYTGSTIFGTNYSDGSNGAAAGERMNGMFYVLSKTRIGDCTDGTSNTMMGSETKVRGKGSRNDTGDTRAWDAGSYWNGFWGLPLVCAAEAPNTPVTDRVYKCKSTTWPGSPCESIAIGSNPRIFARSYHVGGVQVVMADGSVRFISENVNLATYQGLATRAGGETLGEF